MLLATISFAITGGFVKALSSSLPPIEITFFRNVLGVFIISLSLFKYPLNSTGSRPYLLLFRGIMGFFALLASFYTMAHIPLGEAYTYQRTFPIFLAIFAYIFLGETLKKSIWIAIIVGFVGIILIAKPSISINDKYMLIGLFSGIGSALAYTSIRALRNNYDSRIIVLSFMLAGSLIPFLLMLISPYISAPYKIDIFFADFVLPQTIQWYYILGIGVFSTISQLLMTKAYMLTQAGIVGAVGYSGILFALIIGIMMGDALPDIYTVIGIICIILAGLIVARPKNH